MDWTQKTGEKVQQIQSSKSTSAQSSDSLYVRSGTSNNSPVE